jgi:hypothetical protein
MSNLEICQAVLAKQKSGQALIVKDKPAALIELIDIQGLKNWTQSLPNQARYQTSPHPVF